MKVILNSRRKSEGELLVRRMSEKAQRYYNENEITVFAENRNDTAEIAVKDCDGVRVRTFEALQAEFEAMQDEFDSSEW